MWWFKYRIILRNYCRCKAPPPTPWCPNAPNTPWCPLTPPVQHWGNHNWTSGRQCDYLNTELGALGGNEGALGVLGGVMGSRGGGVDCHRMAQWNFVSINESLLSNCSTKHLSFLFSVVCVLIQYLFSPYTVHCGYNCSLKMFTCICNSF